MKFSCDKQELANAVNITARAAYGKVQRSILECIHLTAKEGKLTLDAFDTVTAIKTSVYADITEEGEAAIPAKVFSEVVSKLPDGSVVFSAEESGVIIKCGRSKARLQEMDAEQFPAFPQFDAKPFFVKSETLRSLIDGTAFCVYTLEDRPVLTGVLMEIRPYELKMVAIDGFRMALRRDAGVGSEEMNVVIPGRTMKEAARILDAEEGEVEIRLSDNACMLLKGETAIYTRLLSGEFIKYDRFLPKTCSTRIRVETKLIRQSLEMVSTMAREKAANIVRLIIDNGSLILKTNSEMGNAEDELPILLEGEVMKIAYNIKYLLDVFRVIDDDEVFIEFNGSMNPCLIKPIEGDDYVYMVVPVNLGAEL